MTVDNYYRVRVSKWLLSGTDDDNDDDDYGSFIGCTDTFLS